MNNIHVIRYATLILSVLIFTISWSLHQWHKQSLMSEDVQMAIEKGIDPLTIRCAYADYKDSICLVYATNGKSAVEVLRESGAIKK